MVIIVYIVYIIKYCNKYMSNYTKNKYKGGKLLGEGAHGCVFDRLLNCNSQSSINNKPYNITLNRFKNNVITKMSLDIDSQGNFKAQESLLEWDISTLLKSIPNYSKYFRIPVGNCTATISKQESLNETDKELKKCKLYTNILKNKNLHYNEIEKKYKIFNKEKTTKNYPFRLYFSENADIDYSKFLKTIENNTIHYLHLPFMINNIIQAIIHIHSVYIIHSDIKPQNLLINFKKNNNTNFMNFYDNIPICRISDFGIAKDVFIFQQEKVSSKEKKEFITNFCNRYKFSYIILPPEFNIIAHLVRYQDNKTKTELIKEITINIKNNKLPFWDLDFIPKLINKLYTNNKLDYNKIFKYFKLYWKQYDIYSLGLLLYLTFSNNINNNIIINTNFGIFDYNIFKETYLELAINLCNINPSKRYTIDKVLKINSKILDKYIYNFNNQQNISNTLTSKNIFSSVNSEHLSYSKINSDSF
jgi:serine/threonine protein kinase